MILEIGAMDPYLNTYFAQENWENPTMEAQDLPEAILFHLKKP